MFRTNVYHIIMSNKQVDLYFKHVRVNIFLLKSHKSVKAG